MQSEALSMYVSKYTKMLRKFLANRNVPRFDIDDIAQEVWLRLYRYTEDETIKNPLAFINTVAIHVLYERNEKHCNSRPHEQFDEELHNLLVTRGESSTYVLDEQRRQMLEQALKTLTQRQRDFLEMHQHMTYKEIAQASGTTYRIVLRDLTRAYSTIRRLIDTKDLYE